MQGSECKAEREQAEGRKEQAAGGGGGAKAQAAAGKRAKKLINLPQLQLQRTLRLSSALKAALCNRMAQPPNPKTSASSAATNRSTNLCSSVCTDEPARRKALRARLAAALRSIVSSSSALQWTNP